METVFVPTVPHASFSLVRISQPLALNGLLNAKNSSLAGSRTFSLSHSLTLRSGSNAGSTGFAVSWQKHAPPPIKTKITASNRIIAIPPFSNRARPTPEKQLRCQHELCAPRHGRH